MGVEAATFGTGLAPEAPLVMTPGRRARRMVSALCALPSIRRSRSFARPMRVDASARYRRVARFSAGAPERPREPAPILRRQPLDDI